MALDRSPRVLFSTTPPRQTLHETLNRWLYTRKRLSTPEHDVRFVGTLVSLLTWSHTNAFSNRGPYVSQVSPSPKKGRCFKFPAHARARDGREGQAAVCSVGCGGDDQTGRSSETLTIRMDTLVAIAE